MRKKILILCLMFTVLPSLFALSLNVQTQESDAVMIPELNNPVEFKLEITNLGVTQDLEFYNLLGFGMSPKGGISFKEDETKNIDLIIFPRPDFNHRGFYTLNYYIQGQSGSEISESVTFRVIDLEDAFEIGATEISPESNSIKIFIENKVNFNFDQVRANFNSPFFEFTEEISLSSKEKKEFEVKLEKEEFKDILAGFYTLTADVEVEGKKAAIEGTIKFSEKDILETTERSYGFLINTKIIEKVNRGNTVTDSHTSIEKNILSRLFTSFAPEPDLVERKGTIVYYTWENKIEPGEMLRISVKTNWLLPLFIVLFLIAIIILAKQYSKTNLELKKRVSFVRTKGGEFALKVTINVNARKFVERISINERIPALVKLYERFGSEKPTRVDEKARRIEWNFDSLEAGETRVLSYVIYSKVGIVGKFALPTATAIYESNGKISETKSNRAFFVVEQKQEKKK